MVFIKRNIKEFILLGIFFIIINSFSYSEGTFALMPNASSFGKILLYPVGYNNFGMYTATEPYRIHIRVKEVGEKIYFGFGQITDGASLKSDVSYRIKDPSGTVVYGPFTFFNSGNGFISSYAQAILGPNTVAVGGYAPITFTPATTGDFYIEFSYPTSATELRQFQFFDITVANSANQAINGRVWCKSWLFTLENWTNQFYGKLYVYADDGIVTSVDFNGMMPFNFFLTCNYTGCFNTGNYKYNRKSIFGAYTYPQYKIFFSEPDTLCFPTGYLGKLTGDISLTGCSPEWCINIPTNKKGTVDIFIDLNGVPGYQESSKDVYLRTNVDSGSNCIEWNGKDGYNNMVPSNTPIKVKISYYNGLTHLPLFDVENNPNGFKVRIIKPVVSDIIPALFWDDSNVPGYTPPPADGCVNPSGCHNWSGDFGNNYTINTWWYVSDDITDSVELIFKYISDSTKFTNEICNNSTGTATVYPYDGEPPYNYLWATNPQQTTQTASGLTSGNYTVTIVDNVNCTYTSNFTIGNIDFDVQSSVDTVSDICNQSIGIAIVSASGGTAPYYYQWNTDPVITTATAEGLAKGTYNVTVTDVNNCLKIDTAEVNNVDCEIVVPNVFTPNDDNVNDYFVVLDIEKYLRNKLVIYNRWGKKIKEFINYKNDWDGKDVSEGVYYYVLFVNDDKIVISGTITVIH